MDFTASQKKKLAQAVHESTSAVKYDSNEQFLAACEAYERSVSHLYALIEKLPPDHSAQSKLRDQIENYTNRANVIKRTTLGLAIASDVQQINIPDNGIGFSYEYIFEPVLKNQKIVSCTVEEPYLEQHHQIQNLVRFCEMLVRLAPSLQFIKIITKGDALKVSLDQLAQSLKSLKNIDMKIEIVQTLHDRAVHFNTGAVVRMGRGLHIYKKPELNTIGTYDLHFRPCHEGKIDISVPKLNGI